jgi:hypothetical protein
MLDFVHALLSRASGASLENSFAHIVEQACSTRLARTSSAQLLNPGPA